MKVKVKSYSPRKGKESQQLENDERDSSRDNNPVCIWNRSNAECKIEMWELGSRRSPKGLESQRHKWCRILWPTHAQHHLGLGLQRTE